MNSYFYIVFLQILLIVGFLFSKNVILYICNQKFYWACDMFVHQNSYISLIRKRTKFSPKHVLFLREELIIEKENTLGSKNP